MCDLRGCWKVELRSLVAGAVSPDTAGTARDNDGGLVASLHTYLHYRLASPLALWGECGSQTCYMGLLGKATQATNLACMHSHGEF